MMKQRTNMNGHGKPSKKVSKKVAGLFDETYTLKVLRPGLQKKSFNQKLKEFIIKQSSQENSISKPVNDIDPTHDFEQIPLVPTVELTTEQVENFVQTMELLKTNFSKYGAIKMRLPKEYSIQGLNLSSAKKKLTIRQQVLPFLTKGRPFVNIKDAYTYKEFKEWADECEEDFEYATEECNDATQKYLRDEREYWGIVYNKISNIPYLLDKPLQKDEDGFTVEYASDLAIDQYLDLNGKNKEKEFSLRKIYEMEDSFFQIVQNKVESISGIVIPWAYVASKYSTFCWHTEDIFLYSFNYMHEGGCKLWYCIPYEDVDKMRAYMIKQYGEEAKKRPGLLDDVVLFFSPLLLVKEGIRVYKVLQEQGDLVCTFPGVYHGGFSPSYNICEAVNMACAGWVDAAKKQMEMNKKEGFPRMSCFCLEWILYECQKNKDRLTFSSTTRQELEEYYKTLVKEEVVAREKARAITQEEQLIDGKKIKFFDVQCASCRNYTYLSFIGCRGCMKIGCLKCQFTCSCPEKTSKVLFTRCTDEEFLNN